MASIHPHQVSGHGNIRQLSAGKILKPTCAKELRFYKALYHPGLHANYRWLKSIIPHFYGQHPSSSSDPDAEVSDGPKTICLEDVTEHFSKPCVLDVKIGIRQHADEATPEKRMECIEKCNATTSAQFGIRFSGSKSYKPTQGAFERRDRQDGRRLRGGDLEPEMKWFFSDGNQLKRLSLELVLDKMKYIREQMGSQDYFRFYSSSVLIVYEGDPDLPVRMDVKIIDFAQAQWIEHEVDAGYLLGMNTLIRLMKTILDA